MFDCYGNDPSTKDMQHTNTSGADLPDITLYQMKKSQDNFSDNQNNKDRFIAGLSNRLSQNGFQCVADADTTIAKVALEHQ